jgi:hypothetical protein
VFWEQLRVSLQECDIPFGQIRGFAGTGTGDDRDNCLTGERSESVLDLFECSTSQRADRQRDGVAAGAGEELQVLVDLEQEQLRVQLVALRRYARSLSPSVYHQSVCSTGSVSGEPVIR